jgi:hypothetical protein
MRQRAGRVERQLMAAERRSRLHHRAPHAISTPRKCQPTIHGATKAGRTVSAVAVIELI